VTRAQRPDASTRARIERSRLQLEPGMPDRAAVKLGDVVLTYSMLDVRCSTLSIRSRTA
jgi:hypothetical protein